MQWGYDGNHTSLGFDIKKSIKINDI